MNKLEELLKKKGIGPIASKSLSAEEVNDLDRLMNDPSISLTTKATMLTAMLMLEQNEYERMWVNSKLSSNQFSDEILWTFITNQLQHPFSKLIHKIISHHELSARECDLCMNYLFDKEIPDFLKASFLQAERLKRETFAENNAFYKFMFNKAQRIEVALPILIDICDAYDGSNRTYNLSLFTAALLASCNVPVVLHGVDCVAPKMGYTHHQILKLAGKNTFKNLESASSDLMNENIRWVYVDQKIFFPELYALKKLRQEMVKRPFIATFEKLLQPICNTNEHCIVTGYTHSHYKSEIPSQLQTQTKCSKALILRGVEGSTHISNSKKTTCVLHKKNAPLSSFDIEPQDFNLPQMQEELNKNVTPEIVLNEAIQALRGKKNYSWYNILYSALVFTTYFDITWITHEQLMKNMSDGTALRYWERGCM
ncbi:MAG: hypothetical protein NZ529_02495 [Cytophagaceae bacterium]|nr:hypothetical protein [Cytophagaceae bacterium]MDW8455639.1 hypothetical protein [Cytophagaceae bacterium]